MYKIKIVTPKKIHNVIYCLIGILFLFLNKIRLSIQNYPSPQNFKPSNLKGAIEYIFMVVGYWEQFLREYTGINFSLKDKSILELGPGASLGIGIITLMKGAKKYNAIDVNNLIRFAPDKFYQEFFNYIGNSNDNKDVSVDFLRKQLELTCIGKNDKLNYICKKDFDITVFEKEEVDLIVSQAAFEHFDYIENVISQLSKIVKPGAILISQIDLKTHTKWIRDVDPLNIYRYSDFIYNLFSFRGFPNRIRPFQYEEILYRYSWSNIKIFPLTVLDDEYLTKVQKSLNKKFRSSLNRMDYLSIILCATKQ